MVNKGFLILKSERCGTSSSYDVLRSNYKTLLKYSTVDRWTNPGKKAYSIEDTGDGLVFKDYSEKKKFNLDYCQVEVLRALLKFHDADETSVNYYELKKD